MGTLIRPRAKVIEVASEIDGSLAGYQIEHWSGRLDARILPKPAHSELVIPVELSLRDRFLRDVARHSPRSALRLKWLLRRYDESGAVTASGMYLVKWIDVFDATQLAFAMLADTMKYALFTNSITPNFSTDTAYGVAPYNANEIPNGSGYTTGGFTPLTGKTISESPTGTIMFDIGDPSWTSATFSGVRCGLIYDSTISDAAICLQNFTADFAVTSGTLTVQIASGGAFTLDITP